MGGRRTRREVLRRGTALAGLGAVGSLGGCLGGILGDGGSEHLAWVPAPPDPSGTDAPDASMVRVLDPRQLANDADVLDDRFYRMAMLDVSYRGFDLDHAAVETHVESFTTGSFLSGSFSTGDVVDQLESNGFEQRESIDGYGLYTREGVDRPESCYAVGDHVLEEYDRGGGAVGRMERYLATRRDERDGYLDRDSLATGAEFVGRPTIGIVKPVRSSGDGGPREGEFEGGRATAMTMTVEGSTTRVRLGIVYGEPGDVDTTDIERWFRGVDRDLVDAVEDPTFERDGTVGFVDGTLDTAALTPPMLQEFLYTLP